MRQSKVELTSRDLEAVSNRYDNGVLQTDFMIMKIFDALMKKGYLDDSIVVIIGDHGDGLGEHGHVGIPVICIKGTFRVPLLIYENVISGYKNGVYATQIDVAPTIVDRLGLKIPGGWRGKSLLNRRRTGSPFTRPDGATRPASPWLKGPAASS